LVPLEIVFSVMEPVFGGIATGFKFFKFGFRVSHTKEGLVSYKKKLFNTFS